MKGVVFYLEISVDCIEISRYARSFGASDTAVRAYLDHLAAALVVRQLQPWHENLSKRQVRAPKVYLADSGIMHTLLNLRTQRDVEAHPKCGASWEGFAIEQVRVALGAERSECFFWSTHAGAELDLLVVRGRTRLGFEIKRTTAPQVTPSMRHALADLKLNRLDVIHAGDTTFALAKNIRAVSIVRLLTDLKPMQQHALLRQRAVRIACVLQTPCKRFCSVCRLDVQRLRSPLQSPLRNPAW